MYDAYLQRTKGKYQYIGGTEASSADQAANKIYDRENYSGGRKFLIVPRTNGHNITVRD